MPLRPIDYRAATHRRVDYDADVACSRRRPTAMQEIVRASGLRPVALVGADRGDIPVPAVAAASRARAPLSSNISRRAARTVTHGKGLSREVARCVLDDPPAARDEGHCIRLAAPARRPLSRVHLLPPRAVDSTLLNGRAAAPMEAAGLTGVAALTISARPRRSRMVDA